MYIIFVVGTQLDVEGGGLYSCDVQLMGKKEILWIKAASLSILVVHIMWQQIMLVTVEVN